MFNPLTHRAGIACNNMNDDIEIRNIDSVSDQTCFKT